VAGPILADVNADGISRVDGQGPEWEQKIDSDDLAPASQWKLAIR
jgi:hypothetical protein